MRPRFHEAGSTPLPPARGYCQGTLLTQGAQAITFSCMEKVGSIVRRAVPKLAAHTAASPASPAAEARPDPPSLPCRDPDSYDRFIQTAYQKYKRAARRRICLVSPDGVFEERLNPWS